MTAKLFVLNNNPLYTGVLDPGSNPLVSMLTQISNEGVVTDHEEKDFWKSLTLADYDDSRLQVEKIRNLQKISFFDFNQYILWNS